MAFILRLDGEMGKEGRRCQPSATVTDPAPGAGGNWERAGSAEGNSNGSAERRLCLHPADFLTLLEEKNC